MDQPTGITSLIPVIAQRCGITQKLAGEVVKELFAGIVQTVENGNAISIKEFGTFSQQICAARTVRNPQTGEPLNIPAMKRLRFKPSAKRAKPFKK